MTAEEYHQRSLKSWRTIHADQARGINHRRRSEAERQERPRRATVTPPLSAAERRRAAERPEREVNQSRARLAFERDQARIRRNARARERRRLRINPPPIQNQSQSGQSVQTVSEPYVLLPRRIIRS